MENRYLCGSRVGNITSVPLGIITYKVYVIIRLLMWPVEILRVSSLYKHTER